MTGVQTCALPILEGKGLLQKEGNRLKYTLADGTEIKQFRKEWERNEDDSLDRVMADYAANPHRNTTAELIEETVE